MEARFDAIEKEQQTMRADIDALQRQDQRTRGRLHELESDRAALRHLTKVASDVFGAAKAMQDNALELVEQIAVSAVEKAFKTRTELRWKYVVRITSILGSLGAFAYVFVALLK